MITTREVKGEMLTFAELDTNFKDLDRKTQSGEMNYAVATGTNTYAITVPQPVVAFTALSAGMSFKVLFTNGNTATCTVSVNSLTAVTLKKSGALSLENGDIIAGTIYTITYDGTNFQIDVAVIGKWYDWLPTYTGFSVVPTTTSARYTIIGDTCFFYIRQASGSGTSNATTFTATLPVAAADTAGQLGFIHYNMGSNGVNPGSFLTRPNSNIADFYTAANFSAWTNSGSKSMIVSGQYEIKRS